ncbi:MAG: DUF4442 domain-containing protein [Pseudomonadales bacterium]|nr:DUF4442 domain-containing protein [Pseudomonadales bacterium]
MQNSISQPDSSQSTPLKPAHRGIALYKKLVTLPFGKRLFSAIVCYKAPYFSTIRPVFYRFDPGHVEVGLKKRRAVENHLGTVHALAMGNLCELAAGMAIETAVPRDLRWIPKGMQISYLKKATTDLKATCVIDPSRRFQTGEFEAVVSVFDKQNMEVARATIPMYLSKKPSKLNEAGA